jgi:hypothetical protein
MALSRAKPALFTLSFRAKKIIRGANDPRSRGTCFVSLSTKTVPQRLKPHIDKSFFGTA